MALNCAVKDGFRFLFSMMKSVHIMTAFSIAGGPVWTLTCFSHMMRLASMKLLRLVVVYTLLKTVLERNRRLLIISSHPIGTADTEFTSILRVLLIGANLICTTCTVLRLGRG